MCVFNDPPQLAPVAPPVDKPVKPMVSAEDSADSTAKLRTKSTRSLRIDLAPSGSTGTGLSIPQ